MNFKRFDKAICIGKTNGGIIVEIGAYLAKETMVALPNGEEASVAADSYWCTAQGSKLLVVEQLIKYGTGPWQQYNPPKFIKAVTLPIRASVLRPLSGLLNDEEVAQAKKELA